VSPSQWNYFPSADNTDDDACRGLHPTDFTIHHIWFAGPKFLKGAKDWPRLLLLTLIGENNQEICERTWVVQVHYLKKKQGLFRNVSLGSVPNFGPKSKKVSWAIFQRYNEINFYVFESTLLMEDTGVTLFQIMTCLSKYGKMYYF
jgi:hypothetical protein